VCENCFYDEEAEQQRQNAEGCSLPHMSQGDTDCPTESSTEFAIMKESAGRGAASCPVDGLLNYSLTKPCHLDVVDKASATSCGQCGTRFHTFRWRHHCRICAKAFCHDCSNYFIGVDKPYSNDGVEKRRRVCETCFYDEEAEHRRQDACGDCLSDLPLSHTDDRSETSTEVTIIEESAKGGAASWPVTRIKRGCKNGLDKEASPTREQYK
jgi:hypothetical protein